MKVHSFSSSLSLLCFIIYGCGKVESEDTSDKSPAKTSQVGTNKENSREEKSASVPTPPPAPIRLIKDGKYQLYSMAWGDGYGNNNYYTMGTGAYYLDVNYDPDDGLFLLKRYGIQNATGSGYPVVIGCSPGGITSKIFLDSTTKRVVPVQSILIENTCPTADTTTGPLSNFIFDGESYWMNGTILQHSVYARINYESIVYVYLYRPLF